MLLSQHRRFLEVFDMSRHYEFDHDEAEPNQNGDDYWENMYFASRREDGRPPDWQDRVHSGEDDYGDDEWNWFDSLMHSDDQPLMSSNDESWMSDNDELG